MKLKILIWLERILGFLYRAVAWQLEKELQRDLMKAFDESIKGAIARNSGRD